MIRRFWRWLLDDDPDAPLREAAAAMAAEIRNLSQGQRDELFVSHTRFWWQANRVAACVELRAGERR